MPARRAAPVLLHAAAAAGCSNFMMENDYRISVRTMDLGGEVPWQIVTVPTNSTGALGAAALRGYAAFVPASPAGPLADYVTAGMNDAGLSCDMQVLIQTQYPKATGDPKRDLNCTNFCQWALQGFETAAAVQHALPNVNVIGTCGQHFVVRDASGASVVIEWTDGVVHTYTDLNDGGKTGFGVMTNEPTFDWQLNAVRHFKWKQGLARPSVAMPGSWYPDERFLRIHLVKSAMPAPASYVEAVQQAVHVLNTVTVPMGAQLGTDSGNGEGAGDHTQWGVVYDHKGGTLYWRGEANQNLQRLRLADVPLAAGSTPRALSVSSPALPWYADASKALAPAR